MPQEAMLRSNSIFMAVSNPERRRILDLLKNNDRPAGELVAAFPELPQPAISRHLKVLREAGLVIVTPKAQQRVYSLQPSRLREVDSWVSRYREFWGEKLQSLATHLEARKTRKMKKKDRSAI